MEDTCPWTLECYPVRDTLFVLVSGCQGRGSRKSLDATDTCVSFGSPCAGVRLGTKPLSVRKYLCKKSVTNRTYVHDSGTDNRLRTSFRRFYLLHRPPTRPSYTVFGVDRETVTGPEGIYSSRDSVSPDLRSLRPVRRVEPARGSRRTRIWYKT